MRHREPDRRVVGRPQKRVGRAGTARASNRERRSSQAPRVRAGQAGMTLQVSVIAANIAREASVATKSPDFDVFGGV